MYNRTTDDILQEEKKTHAIVYNDDYFFSMYNVQQ